MGWAGRGGREGMGRCLGVKNRVDGYRSRNLRTEACAQTQTWSEPSCLGSSLMLKYRSTCQGFTPVMRIPGRRQLLTEGLAQCFFQPSGLRVCSLVGSGHPQRQLCLHRETWIFSSSSLKPWPHRMHGQFGEEPAGTVSLSRPCSRFLARSAGLPA